MKIVAAALLVAIGAPVLAQSTYVQPHVRKDGTYVEGHHRSAPDNSRYNNYSSQGNTNPYTGQQGTVNPYNQPAPTYQAPTYQQPRNPYAPRY